MKSSTPGKVAQPHADGHGQENPLCVFFGQSGGNHRGDLGLAGDQPGRDHFLVVDQPRPGAGVCGPGGRGHAAGRLRADGGGWCHEDRPTQLPRRAAQLAAATGLRDAGLKFAYLVLRRERDALVEPPPPPVRALRVVSQPLRSKGKRELYGCGERGRVMLRLLRRHRSAANRPFDRALRGDVLVVGEADELSSDDRVERWRPAVPR